MTVTDERFWTREARRFFSSRSRFTNFKTAEISQELFPDGFKQPYNCFDYEKYALAVKVGVENTRNLVANLINAEPENIYFSENTTGALNDLLDAQFKRFIERKRGIVLTTEDEYGSMENTLDSFVQGIARYRANNLEVRKVSAAGNLLDNFTTALSEDTAMIFVSHVTHSGCKVLPVEEIVNLGKAHNVPVIIDGAQALGQIPVDVKKIDPDAYLGCGHKWLRGRTVSGILYISERLDRPTHLISSPYSFPLGMGDRNESCGCLSGYEAAFIDYDCLGNAPYVANLGLALRVSLDYGWQDIHKRIAYLGQTARELFAKNPRVHLVESDAPGMVPIQVIGEDQKNVVEMLYRKRILVTYKSDADILRVAVSPFNTIRQIRYLNRVL